MINLIQPSLTSRAEYASEQPHKAYQPPTLMPLKDAEPESGSANVPETNNGLLES